MGSQCPGWNPIGANTICAGNFKNLNTAPPSMIGITVHNRWMTLGGEWVQGSLQSADTIINWARQYNYTGVDFDMEGALSGKDDEVNTLMGELKKNGMHTQATVFGSTGFANADKWTNADTIALMLYGNNMGDTSIGCTKAGPWNWCIPTNATAESPTGSTWNYIKQWIDSPSIPNNKIILAATAYTDGGLQSYMIDFYKGLVKKYNLGGVLYWPGNASRPSSQCWLKSGFNGSTTNCKS